MVKIPYGISNFKILRNEGFYFLDRTNFIEKIEHDNRHFLFFLRPRRFGKSLFISILEYYYGIEHKARFNSLFDKTYIGSNPTSKANSYLVLNFNFSGINTTNEGKVETSFNRAVEDGLNLFIETYKDLLGFGTEILIGVESANELLRRLFSKIEPRNLPSIYILIDEYNHFTNELLSFNLKYYQNAVSSNGYIRKFYEVIKIGTGTGVVERLFVTGVAPVTLDSMTSGFNISSNISMKLGYHDMMGMHKHEVKDLLAQIGVDSATLPSILNDVKNWYNGYMFHPQADQRLYNTNLVLYYAAEYQESGKAPTTLLDQNLATDYKKVGNLFNIAPAETKSTEILQALVRKEPITIELVTMFEMGSQWFKKDLVSLLYWMGFLTLRGTNLTGHIWETPNFVIETLYRDFFISKLMKHNLVSKDPQSITESIAAIATKADLQPFIETVSDILHNLSIRDQRHFNEMSLKAIFVSLLFQQKFYLVRSELEVSKPEKGKKGFVDVYCQTLPNYQTNYDAVFELKQAKETDAKTIKDLLMEGKAQITDYRSDSLFQNQARETLYFVVACKGAKVDFIQVA